VKLGRVRARRDHEARERVHEARRKVAQVEARAQPPEQPHRVAARARRRLGVLTQPEHCGHDQVETRLQVVAEGVEGVQHAARGQPALGAVGVQDGEQLWEERRQVLTELVVERDGQLLDELDAVDLDAARRAQVLAREREERGEVDTDVLLHGADELRQVEHDDLAQVLLARAARLQQQRHHRRQVRHALEAERLQDGADGGDHLAVVGEERRVAQHARERTQGHRRVEVLMRRVEARTELLLLLLLQAAPRRAHAAAQHERPRRARRHARAAEA
jgi:hypothetical protein